MDFQLEINGTKSTPGAWEYYREEIPGGKFTHIFHTVRQKGGRNIVRLHNEADAQMIALTPDALEAIAVALAELEKIRTEKLAVRQLAAEANAVSAARVALQRVLNSANQETLRGGTAENTQGENGGSPCVPSSHINNPTGKSPCKETGPERFALPGQSENQPTKVRIL